MSKNLVIVESPSKARTLRKYFGRDYQILASVGHIKDLPQKEIGVDIERGFKPKYITIKGKSKVIKQLRDAAKDASIIYLSTDPDREGEAIAWHIANVLDMGDNKQLKRVLFNEITKSGIEQGMKFPRKIDINLVNAQQARRVLDRIYGYKVSPYLWKILYSGLSAGRVQSVALRLICEREEEIENFVPKEYWEIEADFETISKEIFSAKCVEISGKKPDIPNSESAARHVEKLKTLEYYVKSIVEKEKKTSPPAPFTTSTLQQEATRRLHFSPKKTMQIAQQLYEGVDIGGEPVGLITYMRTDSARISIEAITAVREFITNKYGKEYIPPKPRYFRSNKKNIQDAHEGIRPTRFDLPPEKIYKNLTNDQKKLYLLIWNRFVACQMSPAIYKQKTIDIAADEYIFRATDSNLIFDGFLKVWREGKVFQGSDDDSQTYQSLPKLLKVNQSLSLVEIKPQQKFTEPPPRYTEGTLVREMDKRGIGRPSTYATIISTILQRKYVEREKGTLFPSELGKTVNKVLLSGMSDIFNVNFTAKMEEQLDYIESGSKNWADVVDQFYQPFRKSLDVMEANRNVIKGKLQEKTDEICELCGSPMVIKWSRNGRFLSCSAFPKCKNAKPLNKQVETDQESKICPNCKSKMVVKQGRYGKFWACSKYPECKTTLPYTLNIPCPMPDCEGEIVEKKTGRGKIFYGCSNYPSCKFATWNEPINMECPVCSYPILEKKKKRGGETIVFCSKCGTEFSDIET
jgi:DNA topoisomerase-1